MQTRGHVPGARSLPLPSLPSATAACPAERWTLLVPPYCIWPPTQLSFSCSQREGHECPWAAAPGRGPGRATGPPSGQGANAGYVLWGGAARTEWVGLPGPPAGVAALGSSSSPEALAPARKWLTAGSPVQLHGREMRSGGGSGVRVQLEVVDEVILRLRDCNMLAICYTLVVEDKSEGWSFCNSERDLMCPVLLTTHSCMFCFACWHYCIPVPPAVFLYPPSKRDVSPNEGIHWIYWLSVHLEWYYFCTVFGRIEEIVTHEQFRVLCFRWGTLDEKGCKALEVPFLFLLSQKYRDYIQLVLSALSWSCSSSVISFSHFDKLPL